MIEEHGGTLTIKNVTGSVSGMYTCIATNDIGTSKANIMFEATYGKFLTISNLTKQVD